MFLDLVVTINDFLWNNLVLWLLFAGGIFFSLKLSLVQVVLFPQGIKSIFSKQLTNNKQLSSFQALCTSVAQRVGTGNLAGVATAISAGGEGAVFWMWITAILGGATSFAECTLAQVFKIQHHDGSFYGGPAYYIRIGLKSKYLAVMFSLLLIIAMGFVLNAVQSNTIAQGLKTSLGFDELKVGFLLAIFCCLVVFGGVKRISVVAEVLVPIMAIFYLALTLYVIIGHASLLPTVLGKIFSKAFSFNAAAGGVLGHTVKQAFRYGVSRGLYSNEAGWGSAPNAAACAKVNHPAEQGLVQMIAVYIDTLLICSSTAFMILLAPDIDLSLTGIALTQSAANSHFGALGGFFISAAMVLFGFTTILGNTFYGEINVRFLTQNPLVIQCYRLLVVAMVVVGSISHVLLVWELADLMSAMMTMINFFAILALSGITVKTLQHFKKSPNSFSLKDIGVFAEQKFSLAFEKNEKN